jgi:hypothetical protein
MAGFLALGVVAVWVTFVVVNLRDKPQGVLNWSPFVMPSFVGIGRLWTTPAALFSGLLGVALLMLALGFHLQHLRRQEIGARQIEQRRDGNEAAQQSAPPLPSAPAGPSEGAR